MLRTVVGEHHWAPSIQGALYVDNQDNEGLEFWFISVEKTAEEIKKPKKQNGK